MCIIGDKPQLIEKTWSVPYYSYSVPYYSYSVPYYSYSVPYYSVPYYSAIEDHAMVMQYIVQMLHVGLIHGDLSEFNVLVDEHGPVIIDLPQAVDAAGNNNAESMLTRDVNNMRRYYGQFSPELLDTRYAKEIWGLYEDGTLLADSKLTGQFKEDLQDVNLDEVIDVIEAAHEEELERQEPLREAEQPE